MALTAPLPRADPPSPSPRRSRVDVVIPVYNEQSRAGRLDPPAARVPGDRVGVRLADRDRRQRQHRRDARRRPRAGRRAGPRRRRAPGRRRAAAARCATAWSRSDADVLCYMDVDLSTDLRALPPLVSALVSGHSEVAIGTRLAPGSRVIARPQARVHLALLQPDPAAGAPAPVLRRPVRLQGDPRRRRAPAAARDRGSRAGSSTPSCSCSPSATGMRIHEVAVDWIDDPDSRVDIVSHRARPTCAASLRHALRHPAAALPADRRALDDRLRAAVPGAAAAALGRGRSQRAGAGADRRRQHPGQPPLQLPHPRPRGPRPPARRRRARLPARARAHRRRAAAAQRRSTPIRDGCSRSPCSWSPAPWRRSPATCALRTWVFAAGLDGRSTWRG